MKLLGQVSAFVDHPGVSDLERSNACASSQEFRNSPNCRWKKWAGWPRFKHSKAIGGGSKRCWTRARGDLMFLAIEAQKDNATCRLAADGTSPREKRRRAGDG